MNEPLLVRRPNGRWGWGRWKGSNAAQDACVVARAQGRPSWNHNSDALNLGVEISWFESWAIDLADMNQANDAAHDVILTVARRLGVES